MKKNTVKNVTYAEHTDDPKSWASPKPDFDLDKFNLELERRCGSIGSIPRFRCVWAGNRDEYMIEDFDTLEGYNYRDEQGVDRFVSCNDTEFEFPDHAIVNPSYETHQVFIPRWAIEEFDGTQPYYQKLFVIERCEILSEAYGRIDILSHYRPPAEDAIQALEHLAYLRRTLTPEQIAEGLAQLDFAEAVADAEREAEFIDECAEQTAKALTDGLPNAKRFGFNPNLQVDIRQHSKNLIQEHNRRI